MPVTPLRNPPDGEARPFETGPLFRAIPADTALVQWRSPGPGEITCELTCVRTEFSWDGFPAESGEERRITGHPAVVKEALVAMPLSGLVALREAVDEVLAEIRQMSAEPEGDAGSAGDIGREH